MTAAMCLVFVSPNHHIARSAAPSDHLRVVLQLPSCNHFWPPPIGDRSAHLIGPPAGIMDRLINWLMDRLISRFMVRVHESVKIALSGRAISDTPLCDYRYAQRE